MDENVNIQISGLDDLVESLETLVRKYPDAAGELLRKDGRALRKKIVEGAKESIKTKGESKRSLGKTGSYSVSQPMGYGSQQYVEIAAKSPHFHLVEHGHNLVTKDGKTIGFVQGKHYLEKATKEYEGDMEEHVSHMVDGLLKAGGLT